MRTCITWDNWHADSKQTIQQDRKIHLLVAAIFSVMWWDVIVLHVICDRVTTWVGHGCYPGVPVWHFNEQDISNRNNLWLFLHCSYYDQVLRTFRIQKQNTKPTREGDKIKTNSNQRHFIYVPAQSNDFYTNTVSIQTTYRFSL